MRFGEGETRLSMGRCSLTAAHNLGSIDVYLLGMEEPETLSVLEQRIANAINSGDITLADRLRQIWVRRYLYKKVTARA